MFETLVCLKKLYRLRNVAHPKLTETWVGNLMLPGCDNAVLMDQNWQEKCHTKQYDSGIKK